MTATIEVDKVQDLKQKIRDLEIRLEDQKAKYASKIEDYIRLEDSVDDLRSELIGELKAKLDRRKSLKEEALSLRVLCRDIDGLADYLSQRRIPVNLLAFAALGIAMIAMFTVNPELLQGLGLFVSANQFLVIFIALIVLLGLYLWVRRRRK